MTSETRQRLRNLGIVIGHYETGPLNAITDVAGVRIGHVTCIEGDRTRTGATAILPHDGNLFQDKTPAALAVFNGYGKFAGATQIAELGEINDSRLNDIRASRPTTSEICTAIDGATAGPVAEGAVGAGTGTVAFGMKGGIGTSSRLTNIGGEVFTIGVLVQSNYGGHLIVGGKPYAVEASHDRDGSIVIILATDAPLCSRNLKRLAERCFGGLARTGAALSNGSGDYALSADMPVLSNDVVSPLFEATIEATEEAILNSLTMAVDTHGYNAASGKSSFFEAISLKALRQL
jgi:D-aminopeptidase